METLQPFIGVWDCEEKYHAGGWTDKDITAQGVDRITEGPGGYYLLADYSSESELGPYWGHGVMFRDQAEEAYKFHWYDSFSPYPQLATGRWEDDRLIFEHTAMMEGGEVTFRRTYTMPDPDSVTLTLDMISAAGDAKRLMSMQKTRRAGG
jgi:hypothetical protein